ncbi:TPA: autotransporter outer membrane beta-barrel domain-containing protein [Stenotrophomonas maltophilia]|nr:autotransporter outer membrane beta-barrel domain-containing protein [Stenotrophomonas maltophilia]
MKSFTPSCLALAVAAGLFAALPVQAGTLNPGESATVKDGDAPERWTLDDASISMEPNSKAVAVYADNGSVVSIDGGTVDATTSAGSMGVWLQGASTATINNSTLIGSSSSYGLQLRDSSSATVSGSEISGGSGSYAISMVNQTSLALVGTTTNGGINMATSAGGDGNELEISGGSRINGSVLIDRQAGSTTATSSDKLTVDASHLEATGSVLSVRTAGGGVPFAADIVLRNGTTVNAGSGVLLQTGGEVTANLTIDNSAITGDILNDKANGATTVVGLRNNAVLTGAMTDVSGVSIESAKWNVSGDSSVDFLQLNSGGVVAFEAPVGGVHKNLTVGTFSGNDGTIVFNTVLADDASASDKLVVTGDTSGTANVRVNNISGAGALTYNGIELISVGGTSDGVFTLAGRAVGGAYEYFLHKGTGGDGNWYLRSQTPTTGPEPCDLDPTGPGCDPDNPGPGLTPVPGDEDPYPMPKPEPGDEPYPMPEPKPDPEPILRPEGGAYLANVRAAQQMFAIGYHGRQQGQNGAGAWAKVDGSRNSFDAVSRQLDVRGNSQALSVGANVWQHESGSAAGVMLSSGNATSTSTNELTGYYARGKVKGEALGVYGTWRGGNAADPYAGFYVDGSVQRAQFRNRVEGVGLETERYKSRAWQGAVEAGYAFRVGGASNGGIYLEPQLQVGYTRWDQGQHTEANGTVVQTEDANGLFGRAGVRLSGVTRAVNGGVEVQPYVAAHWLHTRTGSQIRMDDEIVDARIPQNRGEFSAGASLNFGNGFGAWGGLSLQKASGYHQTSAQVGLSYRW